MQNLANFLNGILWSNVLIVLCLASGLYFSIRLRFVQVRKIKEMVRLLFDGKASENGLSPFQAFSLAISGRVGTGNIVGVITAIALGGPGSIFWMWVLAFLGAGTAFVECSLAQVYKEEINGQYRGGPAYYIKKGLGNKWLAAGFAFSCALANLVLLPGVQSNAIASSLNHAFGFNETISGIVLIVLLGAVIFGGVKRLGKVAEILVPFMAISYVVIALLVIGFNISELPSVISLIFTSAFGAHAVFGGIVGSAITMGVKRGVYSSEAGMGTAPQPAATAEVSHPAKQGLVQAFSVYVDTMFVCTATAFMVLITNSYNVVNPDGGYLVNNLGDVEAGAIFTQKAVESFIPGFGSAFVAIALFFFAFTTLMATYYNGDTNFVYLIKEHSNNKIIITIERIAFLLVTLIGAIKTTGLAWSYADVGVGLMVWFNLVGILLLGGIAFKILRDYEEQRANGLDPVFDPDKLGIKNATLWNKINAKK